MPELYGTIKRIRQSHITIQQIDPHSHQLLLDLGDKLSKEHDELMRWLDACKEAEKKGIKPPPAPLQPIAKNIKWLIKQIMLGLGPKVTLSCADSYLVDRALELIGKFCRFEVKEGRIVKIEKVMEENLHAKSSE